MKTVLANKCNVLVCLSKSATILSVAAMSLQNGFAEDEQLISASILVFTTSHLRNYIMTLRKKHNFLV